MLPLVDMTVGQLLHQTARRYGTRTALWYQGESWTYAQMEERVEAIAQRLLALGVKKGAHVGIWGEASAETIFTYYAIQLIGGVAVMINTSLEREELLEALKLARVEFLCVGAFYKEKRELGLLCGMLQTQMSLRAIWTDQENSDLASLAWMAEPVDRQTLRAAEEQVSPADTAVILFTSGSTSRPKAVMSSHYSRVNSGIQQAGDLRAGPEDRFCLVMPIFHCFCISVNLMAAMASGGCLCIPRDRHTASILDAIETCGCTVLSAVPTMYHAMISSPSFRAERVATLRTGIIGGAYYPPELFETIEHTLGFTLLSSLGQTECTAGLTVCGMDDPLEVRSRTVGHFMDHVEGKIADRKTGKALPPGQRGEICVKGYLVMQGYYGQPQQTASVLDEEGWLHTGDLGVLDEAGNITLAGRIRELIIRGGENISPSEIEVALSRIPAVDCCKVVGVPDPHYGEEICACIQCKPGRKLDVEQVRETLSRHLAYYKIPKYVLFWKRLPLTSSGKISLRQLREELKGRLPLPEAGGNGPEKPAAGQSY